MLDIREVVRLVDDFQDDNFSTRDSCPGKVNGNELIPIGRQIERRLFRKSRIKHLIYVEQNTRNIWYKDSHCNAGVIAMGFSIKNLEMHPKSVPMEQYAKYFIDESDPEWLKRNDFELL